MVSSSRSVRPCSPWVGRWIGHWRTWLTDCSSVPHSQAAEAIPHLYKQERKRPALVRRRLSRTQAVLGRVTPSSWWCCQGWKCRVLWGCLPTPHSIGDPHSVPHVCWSCQVYWWVVVRRVQMGVSIWGAVHWARKSAEWNRCPGSMAWRTRDSVAPLWRSSAGCMPARVGKLVAEVGRRQPVTIRKASLMEGSMRLVWALRHQKGAQYSAVQWTWVFAELLLQHPNRSQQAASGARRVMSTSCEVSQGLGDMWTTCPMLLWGIWARSRREGFRYWSWLSAHV